MTNIDELELCRLLGSDDFLIPTRQICDLQAKVDEWIKTNGTGACLYGESRCGKTCAIKYLSRDIKAKYGDELPVYIYTATDHMPSQKSFYEALLLMLNTDASRGTANQLRHRLINRITSDALSTRYKKVILWIDEGYLLSEKEFTWLIDLHNALAINSVNLCVVLVGTPELRAVKRGFITAGKQQIIQRFMLKEAEFHGIESLADLTICLNALDNKLIPDGFNDPICLSETYFPDAYRDGKRLASFAPDFWRAVQNLCAENKLKFKYLNMKCFMDSVSYCLRKFGVHAGDDRVYMPSAAEWEVCLIESGYISAQVS